MSEEGESMAQVSAKVLSREGDGIMWCGSSIETGRSTTGKSQVLSILIDSRREPDSQLGRGRERRGARDERRQNRAATCEAARVALPATICQHRSTTGWYSLYQWEGTLVYRKPVKINEY